MPSTNGEHPDRDVIVVGGGLAGLMTAAVATRAGLKVVVVERSSRPGGRAVTQFEGGAHFNLGPHALYCHGHAFRLLRDLGIRFTGGFPDARHGILTDGNRSYPLPRGVGSVLTSRLLTLREKARLFGLFGSLPRLDTRPLDSVPIEHWIRETAGPGQLARLLRTLFRVGTYIDDTRHLSAGAALDQFRLALMGNVWYLDHGWQVLVEGLREQLWDRGADFRIACRARSVRSDADGVSVELSSGEEIRARTAVLAIDPEGVVDLLGESAAAPLRSWVARRSPVRAACLDVALDRLPRPDVRVAFALDRALYYSVHSASARLGPEGIAVLHVMRNLGDDHEDSEAVRGQLESYLESLQPGWMSRVVSRRFLPAMTVAHHRPSAEDGGLTGRPNVAIDGLAHIFLAGDWVGPEGMLADASAASAQEAARRAILASRTPVPSSGGLSHASV